MVDLELRLNVRHLKVELKVLVDCLFCNLIAWLPYTVSNNSEIRIVATWSYSFLCSGNSRIKNPLEVSKLLELRDISEDVQCVFVFNEKCFRVARDNLNHVLTKGLGLKPLRIHLKFTNDTSM